MRKKGIFIPDAEFIEMYCQLRKCKKDMVVKDMKPSIPTKDFTYSQKMRTHAIWTTKENEFLLNGNGPTKKVANVLFRSLRAVNAQYHKLIHLSNDNVP